MAVTFQAPLRHRLFKRVLCSLSRAGIPLGRFSLVTVRGRKTGKSYPFPVTLIEQDGLRWLVSAYGEVSWVRHVRAAGEVVLAHGRWCERFRIRELAPEESAPILKEYLIRFLPFVRSSFEATPDSELAAFVSEASRHPVFQLLEQPG
jgi:deazaflavin-dependent oxidoreductase (nitroreductase family)